MSGVVGIVIDEAEEDRPRLPFRNLKWYTGMVRTKQGVHGHAPDIHHSP